MFKIIESITKLPIRLPVKPGIRLVPGNIAKIIEFDNNLVFDLCDGYNALGIVGNRCIGGNELIFNKMARVYPQRMIADINKFDRNNTIDIGSSLYSSFDGVLTSKKPFDNSIILAKVISPISKENKRMTILWL
jgi:hypothetical protein